MAAPAFGRRTEAAGETEMRFTGREGDLLRTLIIGSLLQIPTFGFYRFWLTTDVRRHLWSHSQIGADSFEYTGRARELLFGFLVALAILVPIYIVSAIVTLEIERLQAFASTPLVVVTYLLGHYAIYRARRYRATHTIFRGLRFWMTGSGFAYMGRAIIWDILTILTLGFLYPWRAASLERYKMENTRYGTLEGRLTATGWGLFKRAGWIWFLYICGIALAGLLALAESWAWLIALGVPLVIGLPLVYPLFRAIELKWWLEGLSIGPVRAESNLTVGAVYWCYFKAFLISLAYSTVGGIIVLVLLGILVGIAMTALGITDFETMPLSLQVAGAVVVGLLYLVFLMGFGVIRRLIVDRGVWAVAIDSVSLENASALDDVVAAGGPVTGGVGEGLLDALDFGGGV